MIRLSPILVSCLLLFLASSCGWLTGPDDDEVDPRKFTWTVDTLAYPNSFQTNMYTIWGSSPKDVYAVGHCDITQGSMYHYDGDSWSATDFHMFAGGPIAGNIDLYDIHGFSSDEVWFAGENDHRGATPPYTSTLSFRYDGRDWVEVGTQMSGGSFGAIWGNSPDNMWACGMNGRVFHLEGNDWQRIPAPLPTPRIHFSRIEGIAANDIYMIGIRDDMVDPIDSTFYYLYHYDGHGWRVIDSTYFGWADGHIPHFGTRIEVIEDELYSAYRGVFKLENGTWSSINDDIDLSRVAGSSSRNIYASGHNGKIYHYNGNDWHQLEPVPGFRGYLAGIWTDGKEVFILGDGIHETYIFHGKE